MDKFPKYIVEGLDLILSKVDRHKRLVTDRDNVKGGGIFRFEADTQTFVFTGTSFEFGTACLEDVQACIEADRVYTNKLRTHSIAKVFKFVYDTQTELIALN